MQTLIRNGLLADPEAGKIQKRNLLIQNGKIAAVTADFPEADRVIDAEGCIVSPGFIDIHMHEDPVGPEGKIQPCIFESMLRMGVTTAVGGNCGLNVHDPAQYLDILDRDGAAVNVALFAGHGYFRERAGAADKYAPATDEQLQRMCAEIKGALQAGCVGVSFGLRYYPGMDERELLAAAALCTPGRRLISAHVRDDAQQIFAAVDEIIRAGESCRVPVQVSHIGSMGGFGQMQRLLAQIDACCDRGLDIACDCYPYTAFSTRIGETTYDDGWLERYHCDYGACVPAEGKYRGMPCTKEIFDALRRQDPECITVCHVMRKEDVELALRHPRVMPASDGLLDAGSGHPRASGCFARFWRKMVREGGMDPLQAIAKMTLLPAKRLGLECKGRLALGADADIAIFRPDAFRDRATFDAPMRTPEGLEYVLIGGETALQQGEILQNSLGKALRF